MEKEAEEIEPGCSVVHSPENGGTGLLILSCVLNCNFTSLAKRWEPAEFLPLKARRRRPAIGSAPSKGAKGIKNGFTSMNAVWYKSC